MLKLLCLITFAPRTRIDIFLRSLFITNEQLSLLDLTLDKAVFGIYNAILVTFVSAKVPVDQRRSVKPWCAHCAGITHRVAALVPEDDLSDTRFAHIVQGFCKLLLFCQLLAMSFLLMISKLLAVEVSSN